MNIKDAVMSENLAEVRRILEDEPNLVDETDENGIAMAFLAARTGNLELVRYIVEYSRAHMNIVDGKHRNMLHYGTMSGSLEVCRYLVELVGLSPLTGDADLITPMDIAVDNANKTGDARIKNYYEKEIGVTYDRLYRNPIRTGMYPDPSIVRVGEDYYMVNSSFIYFPCIPVSTSKDLVNWKIIGYAITEPEWAMLDDLEGGRGYWAPDISYYEGRFYITATYRLNDDGTVYRKQIVVSADKPQGPYSKPAIIDEDGIDPSIFNDDDGRRYMLLNRGARILELDKTATKQISEAKLLYYGDCRRGVEGPHLLKRDGYYYLFLAEGGTGPLHRITVSRSKELMGRYEPCPYNPILRQMDEGATLQRSGHGKPVQTQNGEWYMVYLCGRKLGQGYSMLGRETALDPITWTADGWPIVNNLDGPSVLQIKPDLPECVWESSYDDDFLGDAPGTDWTFPRPPQEGAIRVSDSHVIIRACVPDLCSVHSRNIMLRRQQHFRFEAVCSMKYKNIGLDQDAGLTCYYDENTYIKLGIYGVVSHNLEEETMGINHVVRLSEYVDGYRHHAMVWLDSLFEKELIDNSEYVYLKVRTVDLTRTFYISIDGCEYKEVGTLDNVYYLSDEGLSKGKRFTGAMVGMYAHDGSGYKQVSDMQVAFDSFNYKPLG